MIVAVCVDLYRMLTISGHDQTNVSTELISQVTR